MLAIALAPASIWHAPAVDASYSGFDRNLVYAAQNSGTVQVTSDYIQFAAQPNSAPVTTLVSSPLDHLDVRVTATVISDRGTAIPLRLGLWSPWTLGGEFLAFGPAPQKTMSWLSVDNGAAGATLSGGDTTVIRTFGRWSEGQRYAIRFDMNKTEGSLVASIDGGGVSDTLIIAAHEYAAIFRPGVVAVTADMNGGDGEAHTTLSDFKLALGHQQFWVTRLSDPIAVTLLWVLALVGALVIGLKINRRMRGRFLGIAPLSSRGPFLSKGPSRAALYLLGAGCLYFLGNAFVVGFPGHPFDFANERLYAYVARVYGPIQLYYVPETVSLAGIWGGVPYIEAAFPYGPVMAFLSTGIGWLASILFHGGGVPGVNDPTLGVLVKSVNVIFGYVDALLIYLIARQVDRSRRWAAIAASLFMFNPAVWFSAAIWGQTHVISAFFVLAAVLFVERRFPTWALVFLALGCLTRPQVLVFGALLGIVILRKFGWMQTLQSASLAVIASFLLLLPFTLATGPSMPVDVLTNSWRIEQGGGNQANFTTVSQDAYSVWPLVTYAFSGKSGIARSFTPSAEQLVYGVTFQEAGQAATAVLLLIVVAGLIRRPAHSAGYVPLVALGACGFLMLLTGIVATSFVLALPLLLLCRRWLGTRAYLFVAGAWTLSTLVPMVGDMGVMLSPQTSPHLAPANNPLTRVFVDAYASDRIITTCIAANLCALGILAVASFRPRLMPKGRTAMGE